MACASDRVEVYALAETPLNPLAELVREARDRLMQGLQAQAEHLQKIEQDLRELRERHQQFEGAVREQFEALQNVELPAPSAPAASETSLERVLAAVRNLMTATLPEQFSSEL